MTVPMTDIPSPPRPPQKGLVTWIWQNFFGSLGNSVLTLVILWILYKAITGAFTWAVLDATLAPATIRECIDAGGFNVPCKSKAAAQVQDFLGKDTRNISIIAKKWVRISQYETNSKKGKKIMDKLKADFETKALELCVSKGNYNILEKKIEVLEIDETPAYGLETKLKIGINGVVECK